MTAPDRNLERLRDVEQADVYKAGRLAATLTRTDAGVEFRYRPDWADVGGPPVATTLPVAAEPVLRAGGAVPAYFAGLLPEGRTWSRTRPSSSPLPASPG